MSRAVRRNAAVPSVGSIIADRYRLEQALGEGGMAEVFRAEDLAQQRRVAIKILRREIATNPEAVERTKREGELLSRLNNPAIVGVESWGQLEDGTVFLVMELLEGETLGERMRRGPMDPAELAPIVAGTCAGLHAAHTRGIVHRDLKPDNVYLCPTDHGLQVKLLDFGISKVFGGERLTQTGEVLGTPRYMSPEQLGAEPDVDARVDVYALGVILYEALAGKPPFAGLSPTDLIIAILHGQIVPLRSIRPELTPGVESVVMRAMSRVRTARFDTAMALAEAYVEAVGGVAAVRGAQHRGMATRALGAMVQGGPALPSLGSMPGTRPPPDVGGDALAGNLRLGTFSGFELSPVEPSNRASPAPEPHGRMAHAPTETAPAVAAPAVAAAAPRPMPRTRETPLDVFQPPPTVAPAEPSARSLAATTLMPSHPPMASLPGPLSTPRESTRARALGAAAPARRGSTLLLVVVALLAGAASAAAVIGGLHLYDRHVESPADPPPLVPTETPVAPTSVPAPGSAAEVTEPAAPSAEPPAGLAPPAEPSPAVPEGVAPARRAGRRASPGEAASRPALPGVGREQPASGSPDALTEAQRALRAGDPRRCVELLDDAIQRGAPSIALRRRADCLAAAGQHDQAIRDYQRFCRLVPDHPSIAEVRPLLESWGRSCP